ncbi:hypothetical protein DFH09DRAFT_369691 [Mycena vulgaris]|nr:hypothetical protein DFH09DRAFT_369691 [Mycena vulgaris]
MASYPTRDASAPDNHNREGQGPPRIDRSRYNSNNNRQGPETRHTEKGTPPEGKTRTAHGNLDGASNPGKRKDRSHESCARESDSGRDVKRTKIQDDPSASVNEETSRLKPSAPSVNELPNLSSSSAAAPTTSPKPSRSRPGGSILFSRALFDSVHPGSSDNETRSRRSKELQKALETAQAELTFSNLELEKSRVEKEVLEQRILALEEAKEKAHRGHLPDLEAREQQEQNDLLSRELEMKTTSVQRLTQELKESQGVIAKLRADCHLLQANANATASKKDKRIRDLLLEIDTLSGKLKTQRTESKAKSKNEPSIDVFNHRLDQVSEAQIKSGVESLNDSLDNLVTGVLEQGEQLAAHHSNLSHNFLHHDYPDTLIFLGVGAA